MKEIDSSVKFAWAYLIIHGKLTNGKWSYYGGSYEYIDGKYPGYEVYSKAQKELKDKVLSVGINWKKTGIPEVHQESVFEGTFCSGGWAQATLGTLVLNNGESFLLGSSDEDAAHLVETARAMIQGKANDVTALADLL